MKVLLATRNQGKLREFAALLPELEFIPWPEAAPELPETGAFFADNALQKAKAAREWWEAQGQAPLDGVLADDSGLCVDALWGGPGVLSARFAPDLDQLAKNLLLCVMTHSSGKIPTARFVCVLAWLPMDSGPQFFDGSVEGRIAPMPSGSNGFGYDPIFIPEDFDRSFGELPAEVKQRLSHRARACAALRITLGI